MDITPYLELKPAPRAVFDSLDERRSRVRFMLPVGDGEWDAMTWGAFADEIRRCGAWLIDAGLGGEDRAAIFAPNSVQWASAALAIEAVGGAMVPIYPSSTAEQAGYIVDHSDARVVFVDTAPLFAAVLQSWDAYTDVDRIVVLDSGLDLAAVLDDLRADSELTADAPALPSLEAVRDKVVDWAEVQRAGQKLDEAKPGLFAQTMHAVSLEQTAVMLYTSGTTGQPKGVPLTHRNVASNGRDWMECNAPLLEDDYVDLCWLPMSHIFGFGEICLGNTFGWTTYMSEPGSVLAKMAEVRPDVFMSIPRYWEKIAMAAQEVDGPEAQAERLAEVTGGNLKFCLSGGAGLKQEVKEFFWDHDLLIIEGYGLTEASPTLTLNRPDDFRFDTVGKPLPSVQIKLADDGEILARGPNIFGGYHKNPEATAETFTDDGWLRTGDIGAWTDDGFLKITGRKKEILVTAGGKNIAPAHIEHQFNDDPFIAHVVAYGDGKKYLTAGVWPDLAAIERWLADNGVGEAERDQAIADLMGERVAAANARLPRYETIKKFAVLDEPLTVDNGFLTPTLKVKRKKVYEAFGRKLEELYE